MSVDTAASQPQPIPRTPPIPKEHGAWALLYGPFAITALAFGRLDLRLQLFLLVLTALFLAHEPLSRLARPSAKSVLAQKRTYWRRWALVELTVALAAGGLLIWRHGLWELSAVGAAAVVPFVFHLGLVSQKQERQVAGELLGIMGLTAAGGPATYYVIRGSLDSTALLLWLTCLLYFSSAVFYVKMRVSPFSHKEDERKRTRQCLLYHLFLLAAAAGLAASGLVHPVMLLGFAPILARAFWGMLRKGGRLNLKRIGYGEVGFTVLFVVFSVWAWRAG